MSREEKEAFALILSELRGIRSDMSELKSDMSGIRIVIVEHTKEEESRFDRLESTLLKHEETLKARFNGQTPSPTGPPQ